MTTLTVLGRVTRRLINTYGYPMLYEIAHLKRIIVVGLCVEQFHSSWSHLARLTDETPEEVGRLYGCWKRLDPSHRAEWRSFIQEKQE